MRPGNLNHFRAVHEICNDRHLKQGTTFRTKEGSVDAPQQVLSTTDAYETANQTSSN